MKRSWVIAAIATALTAAACSSPSTVQGSAQPTVAETARPTAEPTDPTPAPTAPPPGSTQAVLQMALGWLNGSPAPTVDVYETMFAPVFVSQIDHAGFVATLESLAAAAPWEVVETYGLDERSGAVLLRPRIGDDGVLQLVLNEAGAIETLLISPLPPLFDGTAEEAIAELGAWGQVRALTVETTDGNCDGGTGLSTDEPMPLGSTFKLYVLAALVAAVGDGELSWDQLVAIDDELDSLPSGITQEDEAGALVTVRELATRMIAISDNTATDHLIALVDRSTVETTVEASRHHNPDLITPFLTTRELFILKLTASEDQQREFIDGPNDRQRRILEEVSEFPLPGPTDLATWTRPILINQLEWFASPRDLCRVLSPLADDTVARDILRRNPGIQAPPGLWAAVGFKGGSEPGVLVAAWFTEATDSRRWVTVIGLANDEAPIDEFAAIAIMAAIRDLAAS